MSANPLAAVIFLVLGYMWKHLLGEAPMAAITLCSHQPNTKQPIKASSNYREPGSQTGVTSLGPNNRVLSCELQEVSYKSYWHEEANQFYR